MYKVYLVALLSLSYMSLRAQSGSLRTGKKFQVITEMKTIMAMSAMGQDMEFENTGTNIADYELIAITKTGYTLNSAIKRIKTITKAAGQTQSFDSDDETMRNNPQFAEVVKMLNKTNEIMVENNIATIKGEAADMMSSAGLGAMGNDQAKFILAGDLSKLRQGFQWADSSVTKDSKNLNEYTVARITEAVVDIHVKTTTKINATATQGGMAVKQDLQGNITAQRQYDKATGLLNTEQMEMVITGSMEIMGQSAPVSMKGKITTTIIK